MERFEIMSKYKVGEELIEIGETNTNKIKIRIKYFDNATKLKKITKGNWIDVYANKDIFIPLEERAMIPLGFALELPRGWEAHLAPRSSTFKTWGIIQTNSVGVVDDTYIGDNDQWHFPAYCLEKKCDEYTSEEDKDKLGGISRFEIRDNGVKYIYTIDDPDDFRKCITSELISKKGTWIHKGDKIGQFRIMEVMPKIEFEEVESFGNTDRGGFGSTGTK
jgi:dUTP pyrophosphatase